MSKNPSLCYHNPFKVLFVFKHKLGTQSSQFSSSKEAPAIFLLPRRFSQSNPKDSPPGQILTSGSRNVTRRAALLSTEELLRILAGAHLSSSLSLISPQLVGRGNREIISSGRIVQTQEEESALRHQLETQTRAAKPHIRS